MASRILGSWVSGSLLAWTACSLLPLWPRQPAVQAEVRVRCKGNVKEPGMADAQQAANPKAAAGCRSPGTSSWRDCAETKKIGRRAEKPNNRTPPWDCLPPEAKLSTGAQLFPAGAEEVEGRRSKVESQRSKIEDRRSKARSRRERRAKGGESWMPKIAGTSSLGHFFRVPLACCPGGAAPPGRCRRSKVENQEERKNRTWQWLSLFHPKPRIKHETSTAYALRRRRSSASIPIRPSIAARGSGTGVKAKANSFILFLPVPPSVWVMVQPRL